MRIELNEVLFQVQFIEQNVCGGQGSMSAEVHFDSGCEPSYFVPVIGEGKKSGLCLVVLSGDGLHHVVLKPMVQYAYGCRIAAEYGLAESIDLVKL
jgi:hypothetical protein